MSTYSGFLSGLAGLSVTGVTKRFSEPPAQLSSAQLPAQYVALPDGSTSVATFSGVSGLTECVAQIRIVIEPLGQNTQSANWTKATTLIDAMQAAIATNANTLDIDSWKMAINVEPIGDAAYWVIVAEVTGSF